MSNEGSPKPGEKPEKSLEDLAAAKSVPDFELEMQPKEDATFPDIHLQFEETADHNLSYADFQAQESKAEEPKPPVLPVERTVPMTPPPALPQVAAPPPTPKPAPTPFGPPVLKRPAKPPQAPRAKPAPVPEPSPPPVAKKPEWKVLEPEVQSDPVPHEEFGEWVREPDWQIIGASVRGKLHAHKALWRDDAYGWGTVDEWTILTVSDGAGSASLSRIGSKIACETVVAKLQELLAGLKLGAGDKQPPDSDLMRLRTFLATATEKARLATVREAQKRNVPLKEFAATLLVLVHAPWQDRDLISVIQVGDGAIGMIAGDGFRRLGFSDHGEYSSETRFLTSPGIEHEFDNRVVFSVPQKMKCVALMTDGVSDDFYPEDKKLIEAFEGLPVEGILTRSGEPVEGLIHSLIPNPTGETLRNWLYYEKRGSSDDRTLLFMFRS